MAVAQESEDRPVLPASENWEQLVPLGVYVLVQPEKPKDRTRGGILLPDDLRIPNLFGRVIAVSHHIKDAYKREGTPPEAQVRELDKVIYFNGNALPEDAERLTSSRVLVPIANIVGKILKEKV